jgi:hypothetical protein
MNGTQIDHGRNRPWQQKLTAPAPGFKQFKICNLNSRLPIIYRVSIAYWSEGAEGVHTK